MTDSTAKRLIACIDASPYAQSVCDYSVWLHQRTQAPVQLLHNIDQQLQPAIYDLSGTIGLGSQQQLLEELTSVEEQRSKLLLKQGELMLEGAQSRLQAAGVKHPMITQHHGPLSESLIDLEQQTRIVVLGIRGENHEDAPDKLGSQLEGILRTLHTPTLVVNDQFIEPSRVLLAYDGSEASRKALSMVAESPLFSEVECHLVHVARDPQSSQQLLNEAQQQLSARGLNVVSQLLTGDDVSQQLCDYQHAQQINMTVMGAFSHNRLRDWLLGSFTYKMLTQASTPLLLLR